LGAAARESARHLTWDHVVAQWEAAFTQAAEKRSRRFLLQDARWSDAGAEEAQRRLQGKLAALADELAQGRDPCAEMARWAPLQIHGRILDLGCGTGWKAHCLERTNGNWSVAFDYDARLLGEARERFSLARLVQGDARELPFPSGAFDWVLAIEVIEHLRRPDAFLAEIARVLRPGGRLLLSTPNRMQYFRPWRPGMFYRGLRGRMVLEPSHVREFDARELAGLLPRELRATQWRFVGTLCGRPVRVSIEQVPQPMQRWWAQGIELLAEKEGIRG
jgi:SAM-dependent methyltransferase